MTKPNPPPPPPPLQPSAPTIHEITSPLPPKPPMTRPNPTNKTMLVKTEPPSGVNPCQNPARKSHRPNNPTPAEIFGRKNSTIKNQNTMKTPKTFQI
ncbi:hypothetical protein P8452_19061 [Trifolium repens]|nr:hypothetical protein P8452_19061 [Trifolium repens]